LRTNAEYAHYIESRTQAWLAHRAGSQS
jgi:phospholipase C